MKHSSFAERPLFLLLAAGVGCFALSFVAMGLAPWTTLKNSNPSKTEGDPYYDSAGQLTEIGRGRKLYIQEGCWHCHSQFVRPVAGEPFRYGPVSQAWESMYDIPQTFGTRRIGPDLSREAGRRPDDWHLAHLHNPRSVVPLSVMPSYPWLFEEGPTEIKPKQTALDLVRYLQYLGQNYEQEIRDIVYPSYYKVSGAPKKDQASFDRGKLLFQEHCSGCHGPKGDGQGLARSFLLPEAANLIDRYVAPSEAYAILNRGVYRSAMPSFREMPERDLWALALFVSELGAPTKKTVGAKQASPEVEKGRILYQSSCLICHGTLGAGDGPVGKELAPRPKDFTRRLFQKEYFSKLVQSGVPGSQMVAFKNLKEEEISALHAYVTSLFEENL